jgi:hypothetical protein
MNDDVIYVDEHGNQVNQAMSGGMYPPIQARSDKADLLDKIKPDLIVEVIRHRLMGEELYNGRWIINPALKKRALTREGAWEIANLMLGASSQNVSLSKLKDTEIRARAMNIARTAVLMCLANWREFGLKGSDQLWYIHQIIFTNTFITLKQPQDGGIRDLLKGTTSENRSVVTSEEKRGGFFFGRGKR